MEVKIVISELDLNFLGAAVVLDPTSALIVLFLGPFLILILFLPAIVELKKPRDRGPRLIMDKIPTPKLSFLYGIVPLDIVEFDGEKDFDLSLIHSVAAIIEVLPKFEA
jgi:hypothetical protein